MALVLILAGPASAKDGRVDVTVTGVRSAEGWLLIGLCDEAGYADWDCRYERLPAQVGEMRAVFDGVAPGIWGVTVLHDANGNGRMDFKWWGPPREAYGASNNPPPRMGPALWPSIAFEMEDGTRVIEIELVGG